MKSGSIQQPLRASSRRVFQSEPGYQLQVLETDRVAMQQMDQRGRRPRTMRSLPLKNISDADL